jgi:ATP-dependent DNA helicase RecG
VTAAAAPLGELLRALAPPLEYLAADGFRRLDQTRLPLTALAERVQRARAGAGPELEALLDELRAILDALRGGAPTEREALLRRAHGLRPGLRRAADAPGDRSAYRPATDALAERLAALGTAATTISGVGPKRSEELGRFGLHTVEDLLYHLPFRYEDRRALLSLGALRPGEEATAIGTVARVKEARAGRHGRQVLEVWLRDADALLVLVWFHQIGWFKRRFREGQRLVVHGRVDVPLGSGPRRIVHPEIEELAPDEDTAALARIVPVYEKPTPMHAGAMRRLVQAAVTRFAERVPSVLPAAIAARQRLVDLGRALHTVHAPALETDLQALNGATSTAHRSLIFDELFFLQLGLALRRTAAGREPGTAFPRSTRLAPALRDRLPFRPTAAQERALGEIDADLTAPHPMRRLLQGDVGSGKTLVALLAALGPIEAGHQAALMAPTELLAEQHLGTVAPLLAPLGIEARLLTGGVKGRARRDALAGIADGRIAFVVGTHALIQEGVHFQRLGLAIVDEQHRFGVLQRAALQRQGDGPAIDVLVMSATPIPRTLALTLYGDLAVSTLDELPPGRTPITTELCRESRRERVYRTIRDEVAAGHQAYVVYPLVEESERSALRAATTMVRELEAGPLAGLRLALVHGRMKGDAKDAVMRRFKAGEHDVLVSTTVIEVGIDVPNATVIAIEHAERFGLAQLHQLRGRVGRGRAPGRCFLVVPDWTGQDAYQRLVTLERSTDGFHIAEADLAIRGPGDFLGTRQAGLPPLRVANLLRDTELLRAARDEALGWLGDDPDLSRPSSQGLRTVLAHRWGGRLGLARIG